MSIAEFREKREPLRKRLDELSSPPSPDRKKELSEEAAAGELEKLLRWEDTGYTELHSIIRQVRVESSGAVTVILRSLGASAAGQI